MSGASSKYEGRLGTTAGPWRLESLLGAGATAAVYRAKSDAGDLAAVKVLHASLCADASMCERFRREAYLPAAVRHASIVRVLDDGLMADGCAYIALELIEGETLDALKEKGGPLPLERVAPIARALLDAIAAVHGAGIIHRDLKPGNVLMTPQGELKLLDFGTARVLDDAGTPKLTRRGLVLGTPSFMAPEQALGRRDKVDAQSDVWSLGATLFTLLTGEFVHQERDAHSRLLATASKPARKIGTVAPTLPAAVGDVIDRALAYDKSQRWASVVEMRDAFVAALQSAGVDATTEGTA